MGMFIVHKHYDMHAHDSNFVTLIFCPKTRDIAPKNEVDVKSKQSNAQHLCKFTF